MSTKMAQFKTLQDGNRAFLSALLRLDKLFIITVEASGARSEPPGETPFDRCRDAGPPRTE